MSEFINNQTDYILFSYGLAFVLIFGISHLIKRVARNNFQWQYLELSCLLHGISKWLEILITPFGDSNIFAAIRTVITLISFILLLEFVRASLVTMGCKEIKRIILLPLLIIAFSGLIGGIRDFNLSVHYMLGLTAFLSFSVIILKYRKDFFPENRSLFITSVSAGLYGLIICFSPQKGSFFPYTVINKDIFLSIVKCPVELPLVILAFIIFTSFWLHYLEERRHHLQIKEFNIFAEHWFTISLGIIILSGWFMTYTIGNYMEKNERTHILNQTKIAASTIDEKKVKSLYWNEKDLQNSSYKELKSLLISIRGANSRCRFVSLMGLKNKELFVLADSEPPSSEDYSPPGQIYEEADESLINFYNQKDPLVIGPVYDRWGAWISGYVYIYSQGNNEEAVAMAMDFDAKNWEIEIARHRLAGIVTTLLFSILLFVFFISQQSEKTLRKRTESSSRFKGILLDISRKDMTILSEGIKNITEILGKALNSDRVSIWRYNADKTEVICDDLYLQKENIHKNGDGLKIDDYREYFNELNKSQTIMFEDNFSEAKKSSLLMPFNNRAMLDTLITLHGEIIGILCIEEIKNRRYWTPEEQEFAVSISGFISLLFETSERYKAEESERQRAKELEKRSRELETLLDSLPGSAFFKDKNLIYITANKFFCQRVGLSKTELPGKSDKDLFNEKRARTYSIQDEIILLGNEPILEFEEEIEKNGTTSYISIKRVPLKDEKGDIIGLIGLGFDITERKQLERQLRQAQKMEAIGTLAGGIAHDFNNILAIIMGCTEIALTRTKDDIIFSRLSESIKAIERGKELIQQILVFSRHSEQKVKPVNITDIIKEVLTLIRSSIPANIDIRHTISTKESMISGDPIHIHQILINLCSNAAHAMRKKGGTIEIKLTDVNINVTDNLITDLNLNPGDYLKLTVSDTGEGIEPDMIEKIFDPFFTTKDTGEGSGMGLAVVYGIVKNYNGGIKVRSRLGVGTFFDLYIPVIKGDFSGQQIMGIEKIKDGGERLLLVDDEETLVKVEKEMFESIGYKVETKTSSFDALELFKKEYEKIDLIITDYSMPHMSGLELVREAKKIKPNIPIILCTGFNDILSREKLNSEGIKELILKPFTFSEITDKIRTTLDQKNNYGT